jgi:hypothetical protein
MRARFAGRELSDNAHYTYRFGPDGALSGTEMGRDVRGRWQATASGMCLTWMVPAGSRECYDVRKEGAEWVFLRHGRPMFAGSLSAPRRH